MHAEESSGEKSHFCWDNLVFISMDARLESLTLSRGDRSRGRYESNSIGKRENETGEQLLGKVIAVRRGARLLVLV